MNESLNSSIVRRQSQRWSLIKKKIDKTLPQSLNIVCLTFSTYFLKCNMFHMKWKYVKSFMLFNSVTGVQFHPEKNAFEWSSALSICHDADAILASQSLILFFVDECRKNTNKFHFSSSTSSQSFPSSSISSDCVENLIDHYSSVDTSADTVFHRCYFFNERGLQEWFTD